MCRFLTGARHGGAGIVYLGWREACWVHCGAIGSTESARGMCSTLTGALLSRSGYEIVEIIFKMRGVFTTVFHQVWKDERSGGWEGSRFHRCAGLYVSVQCSPYIIA